jgi:hypothetical protein
MICSRATGQLDALQVLQTPPTPAPELHKAVHETHPRPQATQRVYVKHMQRSSRPLAIARRLVKCSSSTLDQTQGRPMAQQDTHIGNNLS